MRVNEGNAKREIYNYKCLYLKRFQINKLFILRNLKSIKPNPKYQKEGTNSKAETNEIENTKNREKSTKPKGGSLKRSTKLTHLKLD